MLFLCPEKKVAKNLFWTLVKNKAELLKMEGCPYGDKIKESDFIRLLKDDHIQNNSR